MDKIRTELMEKARSLLDKAYSPYSNFQVGAALLTTEGEIFTGCNVENVSYGLTICAERVAIFNAISKGYRNFQAIAISSSSSKDKPIYPCGACRQVIIEFVKNKDFIIYVDKDDETYTALDLLPHSFSEDQMD